MNRVDVRAQILNCRSCALRQRCTKPVPFSGPAPTKIAIIGEAPGKDEDAQNRPFVGPAGTLARSWLARLHIDPEEVAWINTVSCYPGRTPHDKEIEACRTNLFAQLNLTQPTRVLIFGGVALSTFWTNLRIGDARGKWWTFSLDNGSRTWSIATWHPAAVLRNKRLERQAISDLVKFKASLDKRKPIVAPLPWCIMCGGLVEVLRRHDGKDVTNSLDCDGSIAWCYKHDGLRMGTAGQGRIIQKPRKKKEKELPPSLFDN